MSWHDARLWQMESYQLLIEEMEDKLNWMKIYEDNRKNIPYYFPIVECNTINEIVEIIGRLKNHFINHGIQIFFRGQHKHYNFNQYPTIYRDQKVSDEDIILDLERELIEIKFGFHKKQYSSSPFRNNNKNEIDNLIAIEPTLQHYGWKTRYIDLVDNLHIGLWFASIDLKNLQFSNEKFGYLFLYYVKADQRISKGVYDGTSQRLVNLREAIAPDAIRPHIQHAWLMTDLKLLEDQPRDKINIANFNRYVLCVIRIKQSILKEFIMPTLHDLANIEITTDQIGFIENQTGEKLIKRYFPSPKQDKLFYQLLQSQELQSRLIGEINFKKVIAKLGKIETYYYQDDFALIDLKIYIKNELQEQIDIFAKHVHNAKTSLYFEKVKFEPPFNSYFGAYQFLNPWFRIVYFLNLAFDHVVDFMNEYRSQIRAMVDQFTPLEKNQFFIYITDKKNHRPSLFEFLRNCPDYQHEIFSLLKNEHNKIDNNEDKQSFKETVIRQLELAGLDNLDAEVMDW